MDKVSTDVNRGVDVAPIEPFVAYAVPVKAGYTTVVSYGEERLAVTREAVTIPVPAAALQRGDIKVTYSNEDIFGEFASSEYWQYLSFEDTPNGDCDYNDVVLHCRVYSEKPWNYVNGNLPCKHVVSIQPVALGGAREVKLGILYKDDAGEIMTRILSENIRRDIFLGNPDFPINTNPSLPVKKVSNYLTPFFTCITHEATFKVVWFIEADGVRLFAASTNFGMDKKLNMVNVEGMPYGISLTKTWRYPNEKVAIRDAYPGFTTWLKTGVEATLLESVILDKTFPATIPLNEFDGSLWAYKLSSPTVDPK